MPFPQQYLTFAQNASDATGVPLSLIESVMANETTNYDPTVVSDKGAVGLMQVEPATAAGMGFDSSKLTDPATNIMAGSTYLKQQITQFGYPLGVAAYNAGPGRVQKYINDPANNPLPNETTNYVQKVMAGAGIGSGQFSSTPTGTGATGATGAAPTPPTVTRTDGVNDNDPAAAIPVSGQSLGDQSASVMAALNPSHIIYTGLAQPSWDADPDILRVNGPTRRKDPLTGERLDPVKFTMVMDTNGNALPASSTQPVVISLLASLKTHQRLMQHVITKQPTRTGLLVNLWGMQPDTITGSGVTGLMANQLGVTDFLSLSTTPSEVQQMVAQTFQRNSNGAPSLQNGNLRIAAKDAFVELLSLFKCNGTVWFQNPDYTGVTSVTDQTAPNAYSPKTGSSLFENASRRNDVMVRGHVVMHFRGARYAGFFKSLTWMMDAKNPFRWNFNFVFNVEATYTSIPQRAL